MEKTNRVIVGSKDLAHYIPAILYAFETNTTVELSAIGSNINKMERLIRLFSVFSGVREAGRSTEKVDNMTAVVCVIDRSGKDGGK